MLFIFLDNKNPGPSDYEQKELIGRIFNSKYRSSEGKSMYGRYKISDRKANEPGPGQYRVFSEFGIYESKYAKTEPNEPPPKKERVEIPREALKQKPKPKPKKIEPIKEETNEEPKPIEDSKQEPKEEPKQEENKEEVKADEPKPEEEKKEEAKGEEPKQEEEKKEEVPATQGNIETTSPAQ